MHKGRANPSSTSRDRTRPPFVHSESKFGLALRFIDCCVGGGGNHYVRAMPFDGSSDCFRIAGKVEFGARQGDDVVTGALSTLHERASDLAFAAGDNDPHSLSDTCAKDAEATGGLFSPPPATSVVETQAHRFDDNSSSFAGRGDCRRHPDAAATKRMAEALAGLVARHSLRY
jgi:hypothetical protein